ncbi:Fic family protein [Metamycoplasma spumans]|uniref:Fic family protein n=1 Tax=Metamycoplasma spumans TaxID=92406 RepID=UPI0034DD0B00
MQIEDNEKLKIFLVHSSCAIEGNSYSLDECYDLILNDQYNKDKTLIESYEIKNYYNCLSYIFNRYKHLQISNNLILDLHFMLMKNIISDNGRFKQNNNKISGSKFQTCDYKNVYGELNTINFEYLKDISLAKTDKEKYFAIYKYHWKYEWIHPFSDGNGRSGRLLMMLMFLANDLKILNVPYQDKYRYYDFLNNFKENESLEVYENFHSFLEDFTD